MDSETSGLNDQADNVKMYDNDGDDDDDDDSELEIDVDDDISSTFLEELRNFDAEVRTTGGGEVAGGGEEEKINKQEYITNFLEGKLSFDEYAAKMVRLKDECVSDVSSINNESGSVSELGEPSSANKPEVNVGLGKVLKSSEPKKRSIRQNLPPALKGLMGEANLRYARGDKDMAVKICIEIIRQVPTAPEPYQTLAGLYEESGLSEKSLQMALIAAHLSPGDPDQWIRLAELSQEQGNPKQAVNCYSKAIRADKKNCDVYFKRAELLNELGHKQLALKGLSKLLTILDHTQGEQILQLSKMLAGKYHEEKDLLKTKDTLKTVFDKCPQLVTSEHVNLLLEVQLALGEYSDCLSLMISFCDVEAELVTDETNQCTVVVCTAPASMAIDLRVKLIITLIHLKSLPPVYKFLEQFLETDPEELGDLYLDIGEALMSENYHSDALKLLQPLIGSSNYSLPGVWLKYAECLKTVNRLEESVDAYLFVIQQAPQHHDARLVVADLLKQLGRGDEAIVVLTQDEKNELLNAGLLYERCVMLADRVEHRDEFFVISQLFFSRHFTQIRSHEELRALATFSRVARKRAALKDIRLANGGPVDEVCPNFIESSRLPTVEDEWNLFTKLARICFDEKRYALLQRLTFSAQGSERFSIYTKQLDIYCLIASFYNRDSNLAYNFIRNMVVREMDCMRLWNFFNIHVIRGDHCRHNKFVMRLLTRRQNNSVLSLLHANNCLVSGTYKYALNEYMATFKREPTPMLAFQIGVTLCQMACQKFSAKKHSLVTQVIAFFAEYKKLRGDECAQEYHYNLGRVHHQLGLLPTAVYHYKVALESRPVLTQSDMLDLRREIAFNLHLIYSNSGARDVARMYLEKYVVV